MQFETRVSKKVPMTRLATFSGFEVSGVGMQEIGAVFLPTRSAQLFLVASMQSFMVIGFPTISTDITGPEKPRQTGDDIMMVLVVQQDELFVLKGSKGSDVERSMRIHQDDLVTGEGWGFTEGRQGVVTACSKGHLGFVMEVPSEMSLELSSLANGIVFRVLVKPGFGDHEGSGTAEFIVVFDLDDASFVGRQELHGRVAWFTTTGSAGALRGMMDLSNGYLKGVIHFKLFVAVQGLC